MAREIITTNSFSGVGAGQTATLELPVGDITYDQLLLVYGTATAGGPTEVNMEAEVSEIRIKVNGIVQRTISAAELFDLNRVNGVVVADGFLPIFFAEPWRRSAQGEDVLGWGAADVDTLQIEVDIAPGAAAPTLSARVEIERVRRAMGPIVKWRRFTIQPGAAGVMNLTNLPKIDAYYRLHVFATTITEVKVVVDQRDVWNLTDAQARRIYADRGLAVPAAMTSVIFDLTQRVADALPMAVALGNGRSRQVSEFRVDYTFSAGGSHVLLTETLGPRD